MGTPSIINHTKEEYAGGTQTWEITTDPGGHIFFANNDGLLSYDGNTWKKFGLPKNTIMRSATWHDNKIFVGGQDEVGYFNVEPNGELIFQSLHSRIPSEVDINVDNENLSKLEDVWQMTHVNDALFFRTRNRVYQIAEDSLHIYGNGNLVTSLNLHDGQAIYSDFEEGLKVITDKGPELLAGTEVFKGINIIETIDLTPERLLILTQSQGIFDYTAGQVKPWSGNGNDYLKQNRITAGEVLQNGNIAIACEIGGIIIFDRNGQQQFLLTKESGLQSNNVSALSTDQAGNLWAGSAHGIDQINLSLPLRYYFPDGKLEGAVYDVLEWRNKIFFGTNHGLYFIDKKTYYDPLIDQTATFVENTSGQVWGLDLIDDELFMAHNDGAFFISDEMKAQLISPEPGAWKFIKPAENTMIVGTYDGLDLYRKIGGQWVWKMNYEGFNESSRVIVMSDKKTMFVSHPYRGIFRVSFTTDYERMTVDQVKPEDAEHGFYVFDIKDEVIAINPEAIYSYDKSSNEFVLTESIIKNIHKQHIIKGLIDKEEKLWYIASDGLGYIETIYSGGEPKSINVKHPEIKYVFVGGFEHLHILNASKNLLCTDAGVAIFEHEFATIDTTITLQLTEIVSTSARDSLYFGGFGETIQPFELAYQDNGLRFSYSSDHFQDQSSVKYSYFLDGLDDDWSAWTTGVSKEYNNLNHGSYIFRIKAMSPSGAMSEIIEASFKVLPPWYKSTLAKLVYFLLIIGAILALILVPRQKYKVEKEQLISEQRKAEKEVERLKQEKLEFEIEFKNQELASTTMHLLQKNETLNSLRKEINNLRNEIQDPTLRKHAKKVITIIDADVRLEDDWNNFSQRFDQVHRDFLKRIKSAYPEITPKDQQLCAYLRMNLNTKEIAPLLNISVRGVEIHRYRLRKKLKLTKGVNLNDFMMNF